MTYPYFRTVNIDTCHSQSNGQNSSQLLRLVHSENRPALPCCSRSGVYDVAELVPAGTAADEPRRRIERAGGEHAAVLGAVGQR